MGELANYSIETDQLIWLAFKDGRSVRVPIGHLPRYLAPRDLQKVRRALKLRRDFFRQNMPNALLMILALGLLTVVAASGQLLALMSRRSDPNQIFSPRTEIVRNAGSFSPALSPVPAPATTSVIATARAHAAARPAPVPTLPPATSSKAAGTEAVLVTPIATAPSPSPSPSPAPSPSPSPSPTPPPGQVLGDSTGPSPSPSPNAPSGP